MCTVWLYKYSMVARVNCKLWISLVYSSRESRSSFDSEQKLFVRILLLGQTGHVSKNRQHTGVAKTMIHPIWYDRVRAVAW